MGIRSMRIWSMRKRSMAIESMAIRNMEIGKEGAWELECEEREKEAGYIV